MASGIATVKAVLSGDTLVLVGAPKNNGPPPELMLTLSSLQAPKLARSSEQTSEPYAWASREFLRKLVIGKQVRFKVEYRVSQINRDFGSVWLKNEKQQEENVCVLVAKAGLAKVKTLEQSRDGTCCDLEQMLAFEQTAITEKKGMYQDANEQSNVTLQYTNDGDYLLAQHKGKLIPAIIEHVRDGASMRVVLCTPNMEIINFGLAGVQCPRMGGPSNTSDATGATEGPAPFAREAKHFTESRLLHRDVEVKLLGVDKYGNLYGSIVHKSGKNISMELLKNGLGKMVDWSSAFVSDSVRSGLRNAEKEAKQAKLRVWKDYEAPVLQSDQLFHAQVIEVISGDCLVVFVAGKNMEKRIYLSSLRAPRVGNPRRQEPNAPWALESKEQLRYKAIGKKVRVQVEYERTNPTISDPENQLMTFASVFVETTSKTTCKEQSVVDENGHVKPTGTNVAIELIQAGLAEVVRHRPEEEKSEYYDDLLAAETKAQQQKKGIHSKKEMPTERRVTDLCFDATKSKQFLPFLQRDQSGCKAVVEQVYAGNRLKLFIPKENCFVNFMIAGIKCPQSTRYSSAGVVSQQAEEFGEEAKLFTKRNVMQRNVLVEIEDMDRGGNAFGPLYVAPNGGANIKKEDKNHFGCVLLLEGLAYIDDFSVERTNTSACLKKAEEQAKQQKKNLWKNYDQQAAELASKTAAAQLSINNTGSNKQDDILPVVKVSEILSGTHFFIQNANDRSVAQVEEQMKAFTKLHGTAGKTFEMRKNGVCAALFDDGNGPVWNRARIEYVDTRNSNSVRVRFLDYGNVTTLSPTKLRPLDANLINIPPQAKECVLGFIKQVSPSDEFGHDAGLMLSEIAWGQLLSARIHGKDENNNLRVTLYNSAKQNLTEKILEAGIIRVDRKQCVAASSTQKQLVETLLKAQNIAKKKRVCLWRYGDIESDED